MDKQKYEIPPSFTFGSPKPLCLQVQEALKVLSVCSQAGGWSRQFAGMLSGMPGAAGVFPRMLPEMLGTVEMLPGTPRAARGSLDCRCAWGWRSA